MSPSTVLYVNADKVKFSFSFGWFKGNPFKLFDLDICESHWDEGWFTILDFQIIYLNLNISLDKLQ